MQHNLELQDMIHLPRHGWIHGRLIMVDYILIHLMMKLLNCLLKVQTFGMLQEQLEVNGGKVLLHFKGLQEMTIMQMELLIVMIMTYGKMPIPKVCRMEIFGLWRNVTITCTSELDGKVVLVVEAE